MVEWKCTTIDVIFYDNQECVKTHDALEKISLSSHLNPQNKINPISLMYIIIWWERHEPRRLINSFIQQMFIGFQLYARYDSGDQVGHCFCGACSFDTLVKLVQINKNITK